MAWNLMDGEDTGDRILQDNQPLDATILYMHSKMHKIASLTPTNYDQYAYTFSNSMKPTGQKKKWVDYKRQP